MRRILIAALLGAPLLIATPAAAAIAEAGPAANGGAYSGVTSGLTHDQLASTTLDRLVPEAAPAPVGTQLAGDANANALWWLQLGLGNRYDHDRRHRNRGWDKNDRWNKNHGWYKNGHRGKKGHWNQHSRRWDRDRDWDRDRRHRGWDRDRRHGHRDWDKGRKHRWGNDRHRR